ncbi:hypothetical protein CYY_002367 [Polysphondylium violaceum]|uniref:CENP-V/GFA domain-containing protein n=1 Tax=Polysphondylium violaceum TaxID=133409 RepID=A0A8J4PYI6_9MYCE|nr:hypothetical protein CYY_002367 [Polysphondylium violaceum]
MEASEAKIDIINGSCHCKKVAFKVKVDLTKMSRNLCNCSICSKRRHAVFFSNPSKFEIVQGKEELSDYSFGTNNCHHYFCKTCGCSTHISGENPNLGGAYICVVVAAIDDFTPEQLDSFPVNYADGLNNTWTAPPKYTKYL